MGLNNCYDSAPCFLRLSGLKRFEYLTRMPHLLDAPRNSKSPSSSRCSARLPPFTKLPPSPHGKFEFLHWDQRVGLFEESQGSVGVESSGWHALDWVVKLAAQRNKSSVPRFPLVLSRTRTPQLEHSIRVIQGNPSSHQTIRSPSIPTN